jgi:NADH dehydrogenase FAD-containing subunit
LSLIKVHERLIYTQNIHKFPRLNQHSLALKTVGGALGISHQIFDRLKQETIHPYLQRRSWLTGIVVLGSGFCGVEFTCELEAFLCSAQRLYKKGVLTLDTTRLIP